jgi:hypothetical protein
MTVDALVSVTAEVLKMPGQNIGSLLHHKEGTYQGLVTTKYLVGFYTFHRK